MCGSGGLGNTASCMYVQEIKSYPVSWIKLVEKLDEGAFHRKHMFQVVVIPSGPTTSEEQSTLYLQAGVSGCDIWGEGWVWQGVGVACDKVYGMGVWSCGDDAIINCCVLIGVFRMLTSRTDGSLSSGRRVYGTGTCSLFTILVLSRRTSGPAAELAPVWVSIK